MVQKWKEFNELKNIDQNYYCSNYYDVNVSKCKVKCETSLRFWENKDKINAMDPDDQFQWYFTYWLGRSSLDDEREIAWQKGIVSRFKSKLINTIKDVNSRFHDYSISPKIRQILQHWAMNQLKMICYNLYF